MNSQTLGNTGRCLDVRQRKRKSRERQSFEIDIIHIFVCLLDFFFHELHMNLGIYRWCISLLFYIISTFERAVLAPCLLRRHVLYTCSGINCTLYTSTVQACFLGIHRILEASQAKIKSVPSHPKQLNDFWF